MDPLRPGASNAPADKTGLNQPDNLSEAGILELATAWLESTGSRLRSTAELALAEARLAAMSLVLMVMLGLIAGVFLLGAWGLLMAGVVTGLLASGVPLWAALALLGAAHLGMAALLIHWIQGLSGTLELPATRRRLSNPAGLEENRHAA